MFRNLPEKFRNVTMSAKKGSIFQKKINIQTRADSYNEIFRMLASEKQKSGAKWRRFSSLHF